ncbi:MAG: hypothetical protein KA199_08450, partial [Sphingorhabdus sp.]|nr:hypothetical protein [Sphingorhabdus sp.]
MNAPMRLERGDFSAFADGSVTPAAAPRIGGQLKFAFLAIGAFVALFTFWSWAAPLNSAAIA